MIKLTAIVVAVTVLLVTSMVAFAQDPTVSTGSTAALGTFLTDSTGRTLYTFNGDTAGVSNVTGGLAVVWPPFTATSPLTLPAGVGGTLTQITRSDGTSQVAYNNQPLYTFTGDPGPNVVNGQGGDGGRFFVALAQVTAASATPVATASAVASATPVATASVVASATAVATATTTPAALPATGSPGLPVVPALFLGAGAALLGLLTRRSNLR